MSNLTMCTLPVVYQIGATKLLRNTLMNYTFKYLTSQKLIKIN